jgi:hypothetical protein
MKASAVKGADRDKLPGGNVRFAVALHERTAIREGGLTPDDEDRIALERL